MYAASFSQARSQVILQRPRPARPYADSEKILAAIRKQLRETALFIPAQETVSHEAGETASELLWRLAAERAAL